MDSVFNRRGASLAFLAAALFARPVLAAPHDDGATVAIGSADSPADQDAGAKAGKKGKKKDGDAPPPPGWHRDGFKLKNGAFKLELTGYLQENGRSYRWDIASGDETKRNPTHQLGRLRLGLQADYKKLSFEFAIDPRTKETYQLKDLHLQYEFSKAFVVQGGHFKPPFSIDFLTSAAKTDLVDRSMLVDDLGPDREWGGGVHGSLGKVKYYADVFAGDGTGKTSRSDATGAGRLTYQPVDGFSIGASYMQGHVTPNPLVGTTEGEAKGSRGQTPQGWTFWRRPMVQGQRRRLGGEAIFVKGPFRLVGEFAEAREQRLGQSSIKQDLPDVFGRAWYVTASCLITGEKKVSTIRPKKSILSGGIGAIELVARAERLSFDDVGPNTGFAGYGNRTRNIAPTADWIMAFGLNWWLTNFLKFQADAYDDHFNDPLIAPLPPRTVSGVSVPGKTSGYWTLVGRFQIGIP